MYTKYLKDIYIWNPRVKNTMKKEKKRDSEKGKCMDKALYWLRDIYSQSQKIPSQIVLETEWIQRWVCLAGKLPH